MSKEIVYRIEDEKILFSEENNKLNAYDRAYMYGNEIIAQFEPGYIATPYIPQSVYDKKDYEGTRYYSLAYKNGDELFNESAVKNEIDGQKPAYIWIEKDDNDNAKNIPVTEVILRRKIVYYDPKSSSYILKTKLYSDNDSDIKAEQDLAPEEKQNYEPVHIKRSDEYRNGYAYIGESLYDGLVAYINKTKHIDIISETAYNALPSRGDYDAVYVNINDNTDTKTESEYNELSPAQQGNYEIKEYVNKTGNTDILPANQKFKEDYGICYSRSYKEVHIDQNGERLYIQKYGIPGVTRDVITEAEWKTLTDKSEYDIALYTLHNGYRNNFPTDTITKTDYDLFSRLGRYTFKDIDNRTYTKNCRPDTYKKAFILTYGQKHSGKPDYSFTKDAGYTTPYIYKGNILRGEWKNATTDEVDIWSDKDDKRYHKCKIKPDDPAEAEYDNPYVLNMEAVLANIKGVHGGGAKLLKTKGASDDEDKHYYFYGQKKNYVRAMYSEYDEEWVSAAALYKGYVNDDAEWISSYQHYLPKLLMSIHVKDEYEDGGGLLPTSDVQMRNDFRPCYWNGKNFISEQHYNDYTELKGTITYKIKYIPDAGDDYEPAYINKWDFTDIIGESVYNEKSETDKAEYERTYMNLSDEVGDRNIIGERRYQNGDSAIKYGYEPAYIKKEVNTNVIKAESEYLILTRDERKNYGRLYTSNNGSENIEESETLNNEPLYIDSTTEGNTKVVDDVKVNDAWLITQSEFEDFDNHVTPAYKDKKNNIIAKEEYETLYVKSNPRNKHRYISESDYGKYEQAYIKKWVDNNVYLVNIITKTEYNNLTGIERKGYSIAKINRNDYNEILTQKEYRTLNKYERAYTCEDKILPNEETNGKLISKSAYKAYEKTYINKDEDYSDDILLRYDYVRLTDEKKEDYEQAYANKTDTTDIIGKAAYDGLNKEEKVNYEPLYTNRLYDENDGVLKFITESVYNKFSPAYAFNDRYQKASMGGLGDGRYTVISEEFNKNNIKRVYFYYDESEGKNIITINDEDDNIDKDVYINTIEKYETYELIRQNIIFGRNEYNKLYDNAKDEYYFGYVMIDNIGDDVSNHEVFSIYDIQQLYMLNAGTVHLNSVGVFENALIRKDGDNVDIIAENTYRVAYMHDRDIVGKSNVPNTGKYGRCYTYNENSNYFISNKEYYLPAYIKNDGEGNIINKEEYDANTAQYSDYEIAYVNKTNAFDVIPYTIWNSKSESDKDKYEEAYVNHVNKGDIITRTEWIDELHGDSYEPAYINLSSLYVNKNDDGDKITEDKYNSLTNEEKANYENIVDREVISESEYDSLQDEDNSNAEHKSDYDVAYINGVGEKKAYGSLSDEEKSTFEPAYINKNRLYIHNENPDDVISESTYNALPSPKPENPTQGVKYKEDYHIDIINKTSYDALNDEEKANYEPAFINKNRLYIHNEDPDDIISESEYNALPSNEGITPEEGVKYKEDYHNVTKIIGLTEYSRLEKFQDEYEEAYIRRDIIDSTRYSNFNETTQSEYTQAHTYNGLIDGEDVLDMYEPYYVNKLNMDDEILAEYYNQYYPAYMKWLDNVKPISSTDYNNLEDKEKQHYESAYERLQGGSNAGQIINQTIYDNLPVTANRDNYKVGYIKYNISIVSNNGGGNNPTPATIYNVPIYSPLYDNVLIYSPLYDDETGNRAYFIQFKKDILMVGYGADFEEKFNGTNKQNGYLPTNKAAYSYVNNSDYNNYSTAEKRMADLIRANGIDENIPQGIMTETEYNSYMPAYIKYTDDSDDAWAQTDCFVAWDINKNKPRPIIIDETTYDADNHYYDDCGYEKGYINIHNGKIIKESQYNRLPTVSLNISHYVTVDETKNDYTELYVNSLCIYQYGKTPNTIDDTYDLLYLYQPDDPNGHWFIKAADEYIYEYHSSPISFKFNLIGNNELSSYRQVYFDTNSEFTFDDTGDSNKVYIKYDISDTKSEGGSGGGDTNEYVYVKDTNKLYDFVEFAQPDYLTSAERTPCILSGYSLIKESEYTDPQSDIADIAYQNVATNEIITETEYRKYTRAYVISGELGNIGQKYVRLDGFYGKYVALAMPENVTSDYDYQPAYINTSNQNTYDIIDKDVYDGLTEARKANYEELYINSEFPYYYTAYRSELSQRGYKLAYKKNISENEFEIVSSILNTETADNISFRFNVMSKSEYDACQKLYINEKDRNDIINESEFMSKDTLGKDNYANTGDYIRTPLSIISEKTLQRLNEDDASSYTTAYTKTDNINRISESQVISENFFDHYMTPVYVKFTVIPEADYETTANKNDYIKCKQNTEIEQDIIFKEGIFSGYQNAYVDKFFELYTNISPSYVNKNDSTDIKAESEYNELTDEQKENYEQLYVNNVLAYGKKEADGTYTVINEYMLKRLSYADKKAYGQLYMNTQYTTTGTVTSFINYTEGENNWLHTYWIYDSGLYVKCLINKENPSQIMTEDGVTDGYVLAYWNNINKGLRLGTDTNSTAYVNNNDLNYVLTEKDYKILTDTESLLYDTVYINDNDDKMITKTYFENYSLVMFYKKDDIFKKIYKDYSDNFQPAYIHTGADKVKSYVNKKDPNDVISESAYNALPSPKPENPAQDVKYKEDYKVNEFEIDQSLKYIGGAFYDTISDILETNRAVYNELNGTGLLSDVEFEELSFTNETKKAFRLLSDYEIKSIELTSATERIPVTYHELYDLEIVEETASADGEVAEQMIIDSNPTYFNDTNIIDDITIPSLTWGNSTFSGTVAPMENSMTVYTGQDIRSRSRRPFFVGVTDFRNNPIPFEAEYNKVMKYMQSGFFGAHIVDKRFTACTLTFPKITNMPYADSDGEHRTLNLDGLFAMKLFNGAATAYGEGTAYVETYFNDQYLGDDEIKIKTIREDVGMETSHLDDLMPTKRYLYGDELGSYTNFYIDEDINEGVQYYTDKTGQNKSLTITDSNNYTLDQEVCFGAYLKPTEDSFISNTNVIYDGEHYAKIHINVEAFNLDGEVRSGIFEVKRDEPYPLDENTIDISTHELLAFDTTIGTEYYEINTDDSTAKQIRPVTAGEHMTINLRKGGKLTSVSEINEPYSYSGSTGGGPEYLYALAYNENRCLTISPNLCTIAPPVEICSSYYYDESSWQLYGNKLYRIESAETPTEAKTAKSYDNFFAISINLINRNPYYKHFPFVAESVSFKQAINSDAETYTYNFDRNKSYILNLNKDFLCVGRLFLRDVTGLKSIYVFREYTDIEDLFSKFFRYNENVYITKWDPNGGRWKADGIMIQGSCMTPDSNEIFEHVAYAGYDYQVSGAKTSLYHPQGLNFLGWVSLKKLAAGSGISENAYLDYLNQIRNYQFKPGNQEWFKGGDITLSGDDSINYFIAVWQMMITFSVNIGDVVKNVQHPSYKDEEYLAIETYISVSDGKVTTSVYVSNTGMQSIRVENFFGWSGISRYEVQYNDSTKRILYYANGERDRVITMKTNANVRHVWYRVGDSVDDIKFVESGKVFKTNELPSGKTKWNVYIGNNTVPKPGGQSDDTIGGNMDYATDQDITLIASN